MVHQSHGRRGVFDDLEHNAGDENLKRRIILFFMALLIDTLFVIPPFCCVNASEISIQKEIPERYIKILSTKNTKLKAVWGDAKEADQMSAYGGCLYCVTSVDYSPDGKKVLSAHRIPGKGYYEDGLIKLWDAVSGVELHTFKGHSREVNSVDFSPNGLTAVSASTDGTIRLWDIKTGLEVNIVKKVHAKYHIAYAVSFTPNGERVLAGTTEEPSLKLLDINSGKEIQTYETNWNIKDISISGDGKIALTISSYELPTIWNIETGKLIKKFSRQKGILAYLFSTTGSWRSGSLSPDAEKIVAGSTDGVIRFWEVKSGKEIWYKKAHEGGVNDLSFEADGRFILSTGNDATVKIWDSTNGEMIDQIDLATSNDLGVVLSCSPDNSAFVVGTLRGVILHFQLQEKQK